MSTARILIVDDEKLLRWSLRDSLSEAGYEVVEADTVRSGLECLDQETFDLILLDYMLPDGDGFEVLAAHGKDPDACPVLMMTAHSSLEHAVRAMRSGAHDYLEKPVRDEDLLLRVERALETAKLHSRMEHSQRTQKSTFTLASVVGESPSLQQVLRIVERLLPAADTTILIEGESGTGKGVLARAIHYEGPRAAGPFLSITCTALPESLLESELFGHEKGAFTDARSQKKGLLELADGGTVFLDEIGDMSPALQSKLLGFLEEHTFRRVGSSRDLSVNVRVIAATHRDLKALVREGTFREDLYFRLKVIPLCLPPLRDRKEDIPRLAQHFVEHFNREMNKHVEGVSERFLEELTQYSWPGNIRELRNTIERAMILGQEKVLDSADLPMALIDETLTAGSAHDDDTEFRLPARGIDLESVERSFLEQALERTRGNQTRAGKLLGMNRDQVRYRIEKFGLAKSRD